MTKAKEIELLKAQLTEKDVVIKEKNETIRQKNVVIAERDETIKGLRNTTLLYNKGREDRITSLEKQVRDRDLEIIVLNSQIQDLGRETP